MRRKKLHKCYHTMSDAELMAMFDNIGNRPENRVKRTGHIKLAAAKFGDQILDFVKARSSNRKLLDAAISTGHLVIVKV